MAWTKFCPSAENGDGSEYWDGEAASRIAADLPLVELLDRHPALPLSDRWRPWMAKRLTNALTIDVEGLFSGFGLRAPWRAPRGRGRPGNAGSNATWTVSSAVARRRANQSHLLHLGWIAERYPQVVRIAPSTTATKSPATATATNGLTTRAETAFLPTSAWRNCCSKIYPAGSEGLPRPSFPSAPATLGLRPSGTGRLSLQFQHLPDSPRPLRHARRPRFAHTASAILEIPATTVRMLNRNWPASGGGYFRLMPYSLSRWMLQRGTTATGPGGVLFPPLGDRFRAAADRRHRCPDPLSPLQNLDRMEGRLRRLIGDFRWGRMDHVFPRRPIIAGRPGRPLPIPASAGATC